MENVENVRSFLPEKWQILSGSMLKMIAVITMMIDHCANVFVSKNPFILYTWHSHSLTLHLVMRLIGRLSFPIFAFLLVEGFLHTHDRKKYGTNLFIFALISEIPWNLVHAGTWHCMSQNVFFTLFFGFLGLCVIERYSQQITKQFLLLLLIFVLTKLFRADFGSSGYLFILLLYILRNHKVWQTIIGIGILPQKWIAGIAFIPINMYNGERGFIKGNVLKYIFYIIYPAHLLILYYFKYHIL